jgi:ribosomal protein S18 acetylase RimI-like enzyme
MHEGYGQFPQSLQEYFLSREYTKMNFLAWIEKNFRKVLLSVNEFDEVNGFIIGDHSYGGVAFISWLGVDVNYRHQGIASELLKQYIEYVRSRKGHLVELYTYEKVKSFYEKFGFYMIGKRDQGFFGQKNLIMNLKLNEFNPNILN